MKKHNNLLRFTCAQCFKDFVLLNDEDKICPFCGSLNLVNRKPYENYGDV